MAVFAEGVRLIHEKAQEYLNAEQMLGFLHFRGESGHWREAVLPVRNRPGENRMEIV